MAFGLTQRITTVPATVRNVLVSAQLGEGEILVKFPLPKPDNSHKLRLVNPHAVLRVNDSTELTLSYGGSGGSSSFNYFGMLVARREVPLVVDTALLYNNARVYGDSIYVSLRYRITDSLPPGSALQNAHVVFGTAIEILQRDTAVSLSLLRTRSEHESAAPVTLMTLYDSLSRPRVRLHAKTLGDEANLALLGTPALGEQLFSQRADSGEYAVLSMIRTYTHDLISADGRDTVAMQIGDVRDSVTVLPIMLGQIHTAWADLVPVRNDAAAGMLRHPDGVRLLISGWRYERFFQIGATVRVR